jgi:uncharacterized repeat protein (TIGR03803 family)
MGTVFELTPDGTAHIIHSFSGYPRDGAYPEAGVIRDNHGTLYGTTSEGGIANYGVVFSISVGNHDVKTSILYSFEGGTDGANPEAELSMDGGGNLYGLTAHGGGGGCNYGCGTLYKINAARSETILHAFAGPSNDGSYPFARVLLDGRGSIYGTTWAGGTFDLGTVFTVSDDGTENVLHSFAGIPQDGSGPGSGLIMDSSQNFYGTTGNGGLTGNGTIFRMSTGGTETLLYSFCPHKGCRDGGGPQGIISDADGNLYGMTYSGGLHVCQHAGCGTIFEFSVDGAERVLRSLNKTQGDSPIGTLLSDGKGTFFGTASQGGERCKRYGCGTIFELSRGNLHNVRNRAYLPIDHRLAGLSQ